MKNTHYIAEEKPVNNSINSSFEFIANWLNCACIFIPYAINYTCIQIFIELLSPVNIHDV